MRYRESNAVPEASTDLTRLVRLAVDEGPRWGVVVGGTIHGLSGHPFVGWQVGEPLVDLEAASLLPPTEPSKVVCVGLNYRSHAEESEAEVPEEPLLFLKPPSAVVGPEVPIVRPPQSSRVDYEAELALVIGTRCRNVNAGMAWSYVAGVTCGNDVTARDLQARDDQWARAKGFDTFCPLGPWLVTGVGEADLAELRVTCRVNGDLRQDGQVPDMVFSPMELIAYISSIMTLEPGDVIMTGTPEGVGPLGHGDIVEVEIDSVGTLRNPVENGVP